jgi:hypothetical protein
MKKNKVLWFDDEHESLIKLKREANGIPYNIELVGFKSNEAGMKELKLNYHQYQAVLLDARFYIKENETGNGDIQALMKTKENLDSFQAKRFKYFVLTGQADLTKENSWFDRVFPIYYDKGDPESLDQLWKDLLKVCEQHDDYQILSEYKSVFNALESLNKIDPKEIIEVIRNYNTSEEKEAPHDLGSLRTMLERIIEEYKESGFIPDKVYSNGLNACVRFIAGEDYNYKYLEEILSPYMGKLAMHLNNIVNDGSHEKADLKLKVKEHIKTYNTRYTYRSCVNQLFELILFTDAFFKKGIQPGLWTVIDDSPKEGIVGYDGRNWYCDQYSIHIKMAEKLNLKIGDRIIITQYRPNTIESLKDKYPLFASNLKKI